MAGNAEGRSRGGLKKFFGTTNCRECGHEVAVKINENGTLTYWCTWCDDVCYFRPGRKAYELFKAKVKIDPAAAARLEGEPPPPAPKPEPEVKPDPALASKSWFEELG